MNAKHTPTPWQAEGYRVIKQMREEPYEADLIIASTGNSTTEAIENAAFIVRACNNHEELLEALKDLISGAESLCASGDAKTYPAGFRQAIETVSKAEGRA